MAREMPVPEQDMGTGIEEIARKWDIVFVYTTFIY